MAPRVLLGEMAAGKRPKGLGDALRAEVKARGLTLDAASLEMGLSPNAFSRWCNGISPSARNFEVLMDFLGVYLEELGAMIAIDQWRRWKHRHW
jgi:transcriptional regulator with XRE-family HTH domain